LLRLMMPTERHQHDDPDGHVDAVEPGQRVEARAEQAGREAETLAVERGELVHLSADERRAEQRVTESHRFVLRSSFSAAADTASTIVSELISSTKLLTDVNGMS
jgi:uncharacterized protein YndB with AHSA1/START domain